MTDSILYDHLFSPQTHPTIKLTIKQLSLISNIVIQPDLNVISVRSVCFQFLEIIHVGQLRYGFKSYVNKIQELTSIVSYLLHASVLI